MTSGRRGSGPLLRRSLATQIMLLCGLVFCLAVAIIGPLTDNSNSTTSTVVAAIVLLVEGAAGCAWLLYRGRQRADRR